MKAIKRIFAAALAVSAVFFCISGAQAAPNKKLTIFYAANLIGPINELTQEFKKTNPDIEVIAESSGSLLAIKKVTELSRQADMIFSADYLLIKNMLMPQYADWAIELFNDPIVIAYTQRSRYTNEINADNWYKILLKPEVKFGYANPDLAPIGYRTLITWKLADLYYPVDMDMYYSLIRKCPEDFVRPDVSELFSSLETMSLDYLFVYRSTAEQHNLKYLNLPDEINLGSAKFSEQYAKACVTVKSKRGDENICGSPVIFAFTILKDAPNRQAAIAFAKLLLSETGRRIFKQNFQPLMENITAINSEKLPKELAGETASK